MALEGLLAEVDAASKDAVKRAREMIGRLHQQAAALETVIAERQATVNALDAEIASKRTSVEQLSAKLTSADAEISVKTHRAAAIQQGEALKLAEREAKVREAETRATDMVAKAAQHRSKLLALADQVAQKLVDEQTKISTLLDGVTAYLNQLS